MDNKIGFWSHTDGVYKCFSNFYPCKFVYLHRQFNCTEQAFMWVKAMTFNDNETAMKILNETDPLKIKKLGRKVKNYDDSKWNEIRYNIMYQVNIAKYFYNKDLRKTLIDTKDAYLFEASPYDSLWGIGKDGSGQNLLGKVLMDVRNYYMNIKNEVSETNN